jgi:hypothetical protein
MAMAKNKVVGEGLLQGKGTLLSDVFSDIKVFEMKLKLLINMLNETLPYPFIQKCVQNTCRKEVYMARQRTFINYPTSSKQSSRFNYFHANSSEILLFQNPFKVDISDIVDKIQMEVTEL